MIVHRQNLFDVVETFDVLVGFRVVCTAVDVLQHVHVARNVGLPSVRVLVVVPKVNVAEVVALQMTSERERDSSANEMK